jgi:hypothetical protein
MPDDEFAVEFLGRTVRCYTLDDAIDVKMAADILDGLDPTPYSSDKLRELAGTLAVYRLDDDGARLQRLAMSPR